MAPVPQVRYQAVKKPRYGADEFPRPLVELAGLDETLPDVLARHALVEDLVGAVEQRAVHVLLLQVLVHVADGVGTLRRPVDLPQDLDVRLNGIARVLFVEELPVAVVLAREGRDRNEQVSDAGLAVKGLETPSQKLGQRTDLHPGAGEDRPGNRVPQFHPVGRPHEVRHDVLQGSAGLDADDVEIVEGTELPPVEADDLLTDQPDDPASSGNGHADGIAEGDVGVEEGAADADDGVFVFELVEVVVDELGGRDQFLGQFVGDQPLDRGDENRVPGLPLQNGLDIVQELRKAVHREGKEDEIVVFDDALQIVGRDDLRRKPRHAVHASQFPRQILRQMLGIQVVAVDGSTDFDVVVIHRDVLVVAPELVGEGRSEAAGTDDADPACIEVTQDHRKNKTAQRPRQPPVGNAGCTCRPLPPSLLPESRPARGGNPVGAGEASPHQWRRL
ncbi:MAG: hypothetical protein A4E73_01968 [Syntrophaceae bacterium PtaU1.Bin231]|nr:MAG: hypothetical protein A4E73_01968 [Syntrophaceae bacterium PtaU1.Bin231]